MTKKLEETFNLPDIADLAPEDQLEEVHDPSGEVAPAPLEVVQTREALTLAHKIDNALPEVKDINTSDNDMDRYADKAEKAFEEFEYFRSILLKKFGKFEIQNFTYSYNFQRNLESWKRNTGSTVGHPLCHTVKASQIILSYMKVVILILILVWLLAISLIEI